MIKTLLNVIYNELKKIISTPSIFSTMVVGIVIYFILYPQPYLNETVHNIAIAAIDQDHSATSRTLLRNVNATDSVVSIKHASTMDEAKALLKAREVYGILVVPNKFEQKILAGNPSPISFYADASYILIYSTIARAVSTVAQAMGASISVQRQIAQGVDPSVAQSNSSPFNNPVIALFNPQSGYATYIIPPAFVLILHQTLLIGVLIATFNGRHSRFERALLKKTPGIVPNSLLLMVGKLISYLLLYSINFTVYMIFSAYWYDLPRLGSLSALFSFGLPFILSVALLGMCASFLVRRIDSVFMLAIPPSIILFFLSGISWPKEMIPQILALLSKAIPAVSAIPGLVGINQMGATLIEVGPYFWQLWGLAAIYAALYLVLQYRHVKKTHRAD